MGTTGDLFNLGRSVSAQAGVYERALAELRSGRKGTHWMWFIFPQIEGLGHSSTCRHYAVKSLAEAREYLRHPALGPRVLAVEGRTASAILELERLRGK